MKCCFDHVDFITISNLVISDVSARKYHKHIIESANDNVQSIHHEIILRQSSKKDSTDCVLLIL